MFRCQLSIFSFLVFAVAFQGCGTPKTETDKSKAAAKKSDKDMEQDSQIVTYGSMREAIGEQKHHGRVKFADLMNKPHFYGVAALAGLKGEAAFVDGKLTVSRVQEDGKLLGVAQDEAEQMEATMLAGGYVNQWHELTVDQDISAADFDSYLAKTAKALGTNTDQPFLFVLEGKFSEVHLHVINGACPVHARMQKHELPSEVKPFESEQAELSGTLVGLYAKDAVGRLTQPANETHRHLVFVDADGSRQVGHVEKGGIKKGAKLRIAK